MNEITKEKLHQEIMDVSKLIFSAAGGKIFSLDLFMMGVAKRTLMLWTGFDQLMKEGNFVAAAPLIRLNLDNLLQLHASTLVSNPHDFAEKKMKGGRTSDFKDKHSQKMTDNYLAKTLSAVKDFEWVANVYKETSEFIHFSGRHISSIFEEMEGNNFTIGISDKMEIPHSANRQARQAMSAITYGILTYLQSWAYQKDAVEKQGAPKNL